MSEDTDKRELASGAATKIRQLLLNISKNAFEIGQVLNRVKVTEAWGLSQPSFEAWVTAETGVGISTAYRLMKVATNFNRDEYMALVGLGKTKLFLLASAPMEDRAHLAKIAKHADVEKLEKAIARTRASRGEPVKDNGHTAITKEVKVAEFVRWAASLTCMHGNKCELNESANTGEHCVAHAARMVLEGSRLPKKLLRRIS